MFVADDRPDDYFSERIAIFDAPPQASGRVVAIERIVYIDAGLWDRASEQLVAKYGAAAQRQSMSNWLVWIGQGEENCLLRQSDSHHRWRVAGSTDESRVRGAQLEAPMGVEPNLQAAYPRCGGTIEVIKGSGGSGADGRPLDGLHTRLYRLSRRYQLWDPNSRHGNPRRSKSAGLEGLCCCPKRPAIRRTSAYCSGHKHAQSLPSSNSGIAQE